MQNIYIPNENEFKKWISETIREELKRGRVLFIKSEVLRWVKENRNEEL
jgi:hypothetical protein